MLTRTIVAVLLGVLWVFYLAFFGGMAVNTQLWIIVASPAAYLVTFGVVFAIPWLSGLRPGVSGSACALLVLTAAPSLLVLNAMGGSLAGWWKLLALNFAYALLAMVAFRAMGGIEEGQPR